MRRLSLVVLVASAVMAGCIASESSTGPDTDVVGVWNLQSLSGAVLPAIWDQDTSAHTASEIRRIDIVSEQLTFGAAAMSFVTQYKITYGDNHIASEIDTLSGTWSRTGANVVMTGSIATSQGPYTWTFTAKLASDGSLSYTDDFSDTWLYRK